ncbi:MAG TPA: metallophosphoesterase, partial [Flavisolibacter sp.]
MIRSLLFMMSSVAALSALGQDSVTDGPFIFYKGDFMYVEGVQNGVPEKDSFRVSKTTKARTVKVRVPNTKNAFFNVPLKSCLTPEPSVYKPSDKLLVVSDIEGSFDGLQKLLLTARVIDGQFKWTFGDGHLVVVGDMVDRGREVTASLWLLYKLEEEAKAAGGHVHVILGNHEIMNLSEDFRYAHPKYTQVAALMGREFYEFYSRDSELGRWLRTKNIIEKVGDLLFTHAGISPAMNRYALPIDTINTRARPYYDQDGLEDVLRAGNVMNIFDGNTSPFWFRGYFVHPTVSEEQV